MYSDIVKYWKTHRQPHFKNEINKIYGTWRILRETKRDELTNLGNFRKNKNAYWYCVCILCGEKRHIRADNLRRIETHPRLELQCYCKKQKSHDFIVRKRLQKRWKKESDLLYKSKT